MSGARRHEGFVPGRHVIDAYGDGGFRFAGMSHRGSILALPSGIHAWPVREVDELTYSSFAPVVAEADQIEVLLIGIGVRIAPLPGRLLDRLRAHGLRVDAMQTGAAARTYSIMAAENRAVAAALIAVA